MNQICFVRVSATSNCFVTESRLYIAIDNETDIVDGANEILFQYRIHIMTEIRGI